MDDLVQFLRDRLAEDERIARQAASEFGAAWTVDGESVGSEIEYVSVVEEPGSPIGFIAAHDPARVLREVEAKRNEIERHEPTSADYDGRRACLACGGYTVVPGWGERGRRETWPCPPLRMIAISYADRPDYRTEWRP